MSQVFTAEWAVEILVAEGHDRADVLAALDSLIDAGLELDQPEPAERQMWLTADERRYGSDPEPVQRILSATELDALRDQLRSAQ